MLSKVDILSVGIFVYLGLDLVLGYFTVKFWLSGGTPNMSIFYRNIGIKSSIMVKMTSNRVQNDHVTI